ncbi:hypothetical protein Tco_0612505 [Tanacetum coccineum]
MLEEPMNIKDESSRDVRTHCLPNDEWKDFERTNNIEADTSSNYNPYLDVFRIFNDRTGANNDYETQKDQGWFDEHELMEYGNDDIDNLEDYLVRKDAPYYGRRGGAIQRKKVQTTWNSLRETTNMQIREVRGTLLDD